MLHLDKTFLFKQFEIYMNMGYILWNLSLTFWINISDHVIISIYTYFNLYNLNVLFSLTCVENRSTCDVRESLATCRLWSRSDRNSGDHGDHCTATTAVAIDPSIHERDCSALWTRCNCRTAWAQTSRQKLWRARNGGGTGCYSNYSNFRQTPPPFRILQLIINGR